MDQESASVTATAPIPRRIPITEDIPILPDARRNQTNDSIPRTMALRARIPVSITHERTPRIRLAKPGQFLRFFLGAAGAGSAAGGVPGGADGPAAGGAATAVCGCAPSGFPQLLQNLLLSGFCAPHSLQNIHNPPAVYFSVFLPGLVLPVDGCPSDVVNTGGDHVRPPVAPWPLSMRRRQLSLLISPINIRLIRSSPMYSQAALLLFFIATSQRQSILRYA